MPSSPDPSPSSRRRRRSDHTTAQSPQFCPKKLKSAASGESTMATLRAGRGPQNVFQPQLGAKRLVIKNLRKQPDVDSRAENHYKKAIEELGSALQAVFAGAKPTVPLERLFRHVEDLCRSDRAPQVYSMLKDYVVSHLMKTVLPRVVRAGGNSNQDTLTAVLREWGEWNKQSRLVRSTFIYLDRTYMLSVLHTSINDLMLQKFKKMAFVATQQDNDVTPGSRAIAGICELIEFDRRGDTRKDSGLIKQSISMLYVLGAYIKYFEPVFLQQSREFYTDFGASRSASPLKDYIVSCERLFRGEETRRIEFNLETTTQKQLMESAHKILVHEYTDKLLNGGALTELLQAKDVASMRSLYELLRLSGIEKKLKDPWSDYVRTAVESIIADKDHGDDMVVRLLGLRRLIDLMVRDAFERDDDLRKAMRDAFGKAMNDRKVASCWSIGTSKVGELLAKHMDRIMREGVRKLPDELISDLKDRAAAEKAGQASTADEDAELDRQLDQALELSRFVEGKDTFDAFYKKDLARRLLMGRSANQDAERNMLTKLRNERGREFTIHLEQMFKDQDLAKDEMEGWKQTQEGQPSVDLNVMVLTKSSWPTYPEVQLNLDDAVAKEIEHFDSYYRGKHTGRNLEWKHSLAHCQLTARFPRGTKDLLVSGFQASVLLLFNQVADDGSLTYDQIRTGTGLQGNELDRTLQSLACAKFRVITKHPKGREVKPTDTFTYNKAFRDEKRRIKINQIQLKETKEENDATHERIARDRRFETQAAIVRIMKSRKTMGHSDLVAEVIGMMKTRGPVEPAAIKKEIENLIEKDYLEREDNSYTYLA